MAAIAPTGPAFHAATLGRQTSSKPRRRFAGWRGHCTAALTLTLSRPTGEGIFDVPGLCLVSSLASAAGLPSLRIHSRIASTAVSPVSRLPTPDSRLEGEDRGLARRSASSEQGGGDCGTLESHAPPGGRSSHRDRRNPSRTKSARCPPLAPSPVGRERVGVRGTLQSYLIRHRRSRFGLDWNHRIQVTVHRSAWAWSRGARGCEGSHAHWPGLR